MSILRLLGQVVVQIGRAVWSLPKTISNAVKRRQQRIIMGQLQAERLDRIRNPSKYLGK